LRFLLDDPSAMGWWRGLGRSIYPAPFVEHVERTATLHADR
jgi:hypothetical protein